MKLWSRIVTGVKKVIGTVKRKIVRKPQDVGGITIVSPPKPTPVPVPVDREKFGETWDIIDKAQIRRLRYNDLSPWDRRYFNAAEKKTRIGGGSPQQWVQDYWTDNLYAEYYPEGEAQWSTESSELITWVIRTSTTDGRVFGVDADGNWGWGIAK